MNEFRYILDPGPKKHVCPSCGKKRFVQYLDTETGSYMSEEYGRCDREQNCGYHLNPYRAGYKPDNEITTYRPKPKPKPLSYISFDKLTAGIKAYDKNNFVKFLADKIGTDKTKEVIKKYYIGTSNRWNGATIFWQVDSSFKVRHGKIMLYDPKTGRRSKQHFNSVRKVLQLEGNFKQCLFGEHLLKENKTVAIVESEKTAIIASVYMPNYLWLATGGLSNLNEDKFKVLNNRDVILFPDLGAFDKWSEKAKQFGSHFIVSDYLEKNAPEKDKHEGFDIADYLLQTDWQTFQGNNIEINEYGYPTSWDEPLEKIIKKNPVVGKLRDQLDLVII